MARKSAKKAVKGRVVPVSEKTQPPPQPQQNLPSKEQALMSFKNATDKMNLPLEGHRYFAQCFQVLHAAIAPREGSE